MHLVVYQFAFSYFIAMKQLMFAFIFIAVAGCNGKESSKKPNRTISTTVERNAEISTSREETTTPSVEPETPPVIIIADPEPEPEPEPEVITPEIKEEAQLPPVITIADPERFPAEEIPKYDYSLLSSKGIHIEGKSILSELNYPAAIYCSNTKYLNSDKINELKSFMSSLDNEFTPCMDDIQIKTTVLINLIQKSIIELESKSQSRFCPRIYLAIETNVI